MHSKKQAVQKNFEEKSSYFAKSLPNMLVVDHGSFLAVDCGLPSDTFNVIVARDLADPAHLLNEGVGYFMSKSFPMAIWYWEQDGDKADVDGLLAYGLTHTETNVAMVAELATSNCKVNQPKDLIITYAQSAPDIQQYGAFIARLFGHSAEGNNVAAYFKLISEKSLRAFPAMRHYLGRWQNKVVASGALFIGSKTIGIYDIVTHSDYRRKGIGSAMFAHLLNEAISYRHRYAVLQASPQGMEIYLKAGFVAVGDVQVFEHRALL